MLRLWQEIARDALNRLQRAGKLPSSTDAGELAREMAEHAVTGPNAIDAMISVLARHKAEAA